MTGRRQWRVLIVDDFAIFRETIKAVLALDPRFNVVAEAGQGEEAVRLAQQALIDLVLMDLHLPGINGLAATEAIKTRYPQITILILSNDWSPAYERRAKAVGVRARLAKQTLSLQALHRALDLDH
jgi:pilus assembly protein CpaE